MECDVSDVECYLLDPHWTARADTSVARGQIGSDLRRPHHLGKGARPVTQPLQKMYCEE